MTRAFLDASVLFAASYSSTGASRELIRLAFQGKVQLVISDDVMEEVERNLTAKHPETLDMFQQILELIPFEITTVTVKDAPIVAAAKKTQIDYLTSFDRRHLVDVPSVAQGSGLKIVLPHKLLEEIRE